MIGELNVGLVGNDVNVDAEWTAKHNGDLAAESVPLAIARGLVFDQVKKNDNR